MAKQQQRNTRSRDLLIKDFLKITFELGYISKNMRHNQASPVLLVNRKCWNTDTSWRNVDNSSTWNVDTSSTWNVDKSILTRRRRWWHILCHLTWDAVFNMGGNHLNKERWCVQSEHLFDKNAACSPSFQQILIFFMWTFCEYRMLTYRCGHNVKKKCWLDHVNNECWWLPPVNRHRYLKINVLTTRNVVSSKIPTQSLQVTWMP